jgi:hypothetical protein
MTTQSRTDAIIGKAFRWSLAAFAVIGVSVAAAVFLLREEEVPEVVREELLLLATRQDVEAALPSVPYTDITVSAGIRFRHESGARGEKMLPETMGPGCAFFDYNGDDDIDLLLVNSMAWPGADTTSLPPTQALYQNDGRGSFTDVTTDVGLGTTFYGQGVAVGDYDSDGHVDVFFTAVGENRLLRNVDGRFEDVTQTAGVSGDAEAWSTSAGFFDADGDGDLDLFVCNYVRWSPEINAAVDYRLTGTRRGYGPPAEFGGSQPFFYRNRGDGTFESAAKQAGFHIVNEATGVPVAKALAITPLDFDGDGWMDLFVANDTVRNFLFRNLKDGTFEEVGNEFGVAFDSNGAATGSMGTDVAFFRGDGTLGIGVGNFANEMSSLYVVAAGDSLFTDEAIAEGVGPASRKLLSFGLFFFDVDLDGRLDLFQTNGHLEEEINEIQPSQHYRQPSQLFWNRGADYTSSFVPLDRDLTGDLSLEVVGRGAAFADIDADGDLDIVLTQTGDRALLLRNDQVTGNEWLRVRLKGQNPNRDAIGAWVEIEAGDRKQRQQVMPTRSYLSQTELTLTFGLGDATQANAVRVRWPGKTDWQEIGALAGGKTHVVLE